MDTYEFEDGKFEFFTARSRARLTPGVVIIFRVRVDTWPEKRAREKHITFDYLRPSSAREIEKWMETHPDYPVVPAEDVFGPGGRLITSETERLALDVLIKQEVAAMMKEKPETLYWTGGTDCGIEDCVEHAHLRKQDDTIEGEDRSERD